MNVHTAKITHLPAVILAGIIAYKDRNNIMLDDTAFNKK